MRLKSLQRSRSPQLSCLWRLANTHCVNQFLRVFHLFTHLSAYPSSPVYHSSAYLSIHRAIIYQSVPPPTPLPTHTPYTYPSSINPFFHPPIYPSAYSSMPPPTHTPINLPSIHLIHPSTSSIHPSVHLSIHLSIHLLLSFTVFCIPIHPSIYQPSQPTLTWFNLAYA